MEKLKDLGELLTGIGTVILCSTALLAFLGYKRQIKREKLRWLQQLYEKFYNQKRYKPVRQRIDFDDLDDLLPLLHGTQNMKACPTLEERNKIDEFTDYLNFFEWISFLENIHELKFKNLDVMFNYYLTRILQINDQHSGQIVRYLIKNGYGQFFELLRKHYAPKTANLFVYGTLKKGGKLHSEIEACGAVFLGNAKSKGKLFQIENESYPGAVASDSEEYIWGELYRVPDPLKSLWKIDDAEGCDEGLFQRKLVDVWSENQKVVKAWSYFYAKPIGNSIQITSGRFSFGCEFKAS